VDHGGHLGLDARIYSVAQTFSVGAFTPAAVQRDYQWEERQCLELFADLERAFAAEEIVEDETENSAAIEDTAGDPSAIDLISDASAPMPPRQRDYFLGTLVLRPVREDSFEVFDGLQRLTTLTALLSVLRDFLGTHARAESLEALISDEQGRPRLALHGRDTTLREEIQKRGEAAKSRRSAPPSDMSARLRAAAGAFRRELTRWTAERRAAFADFLMHRVRFVAILTPDQMFASQIFVTTNARGMALDRVEVFKGQLIDIAGDDLTAALIAQTWTEVQSEIGDDLDDMLAALDFIERREPQGADLLTQLADHLHRRYGSAGIGEWTSSRLRLLSRAWRDLHTRLYEPVDALVGASIWKLRFFKWRDWKPLALIWTAQFLRQAESPAAAPERARVLFARRFDALHRRCMAIQLTGNSELDRNKIFARALGQVARTRDPLDRQGALGFDASAHARMQETLRMPLVHDDTRLTLVRWLEAALWADRPPRSIARASVEHVLPQRPHANAQWLADFPNEDARFNFCHALGNLALADYRANEGMGNADFTQKLPTLKTQAQKYKLLSDIVAHDAWTAEVIAARTKRLGELAWRELALPPPRTPAPHV